jgi:MFS family permease
VFATLLPITLAVFVGFLAIGAVLPVLPVHVHHDLGLSAVVVGVVAGAQFAAALLTRAWAGGLADTRGSKRAVTLGAWVSAAAGGTYLLSTLAPGQPAVAAAVLLAGRVLQGCAESLIVTGALSWGVGLVGPQNAGKVMAWVGIAMYGAYAIGAPLGAHVQGAHQFAGVAVLSTVLPLLAWLVIAPVRPVAITNVKRVPFYRVIGSVWLPGLGLALSSAGFGLLTAFVPLLFADHGWAGPALAFTWFGVAFVGARLVFGHLPDKIGGAQVALACVLIEAAGLALVWQAGSADWVHAGAALIGFGYSLAFPGFGVEAVRRAPPQSRGVAMGAYVAFLDLSLGIVNPGAGAIAKGWGIDSVFFCGALAAVVAALVALRLLWTRVRPQVA